MDVWGCTNFAREWNDQVTSIRTNGHCFMLWENNNCQGIGIRIPNDAANLGSRKFNDEASSIGLCNPVQPKTWQEHWAEHVQIVQRVYADSDVAIYFDKDVDRSITWPNTFIGDLWRYTKRVYGNFGSENNLYAIFHTGKYSGGHPATYFDAGHDNRNVIDCGSLSRDAWITGRENDLDLVTHEVAHIIEAACKGIKNSPQFGIWGDSKWADIFTYDAYLGIGRSADAKRWFNLMQTTKDTIPRPNSYWFRDWFYPIYSNYGRTQVLSNYFTLLAQHFPKNFAGNTYSRDMNWGEFIHFWSGAAGKNLKTLATSAFGWSREWETQFNRARTQFPSIRYSN